MKVLVDTSMWIDHFRRGNDHLKELLMLDFVLIHPFIGLEIACGNIPQPRIQTLRLFNFLSMCQQSTVDEVNNFIEREKLYGLGYGMVDLALLTSCLITPNSCLWTCDKRLHQLASRFSIAYSPH
jgi:hypothetical protein